MSAPGYSHDPDRRVACMRLFEGERAGWCSIAHRYTDTAEGHTRRLNRAWTNTRSAWVVVPLTVAKGLR